ncbi:HAD family hydrolase [Tepidimonas taiwanensis]|uniref:HAD family hydrolase n=1 Tax=Tepidimonas taiwanensis TaxID=307486 RepID=UPI000A8AC25D|nr:HAD-IA family hydrolase [Tepidimonas taiwanensis]
MFDPARVRAITLDLDDTLWPVRPTIERAEAALQDWLRDHAPATAALLADAPLRQAIRADVEQRHADRWHDLTFLRREAIREALRRAGDDPALADPAFEVFYVARQRVELYADARPALEALAARYPVVALSNGNADVQRIGIGHWFVAQVGAREAGVAKPDARIFHTAAAKAGVAPAAVLHVGDDAHHDALGALRAGMQSAWIDRAGHGWPQALARGGCSPMHRRHGPPDAQPHERPHVHVRDLLALCDALGLSCPASAAARPPVSAPLETCRC